MSMLVVKMNAKMGKKLRRNIKDMGFPASTTKMEYGFDTKKEISFPLTLSTRKGQPVGFTRMLNAGGSWGLAK